MLPCYMLPKRGRPNSAGILKAHVPIVIEGMPGTGLLLTIFRIAVTVHNLHQSGASLSARVFSALSP